MSFTLLVVDDKYLTRRNLTIFFEQLGHHVHEANAGEAAFALMARLNFDVVISDLRLPGTANGLDVLKHCAQTHPKSGLILITAFGSDEVRAEADKLGALYYEKPISLNEMHAGIETLTHSRNPAT
jgi:DNA-binding NtrC family response regulator